ncbi:MAG: LytTR family DNA-binding domain-containing protein [Saonia sp.]
MKVRVLIIEDEPSAQKHLIKLLKNQELKMDVLACLSGVKDAVHWLEDHPIPDLIFMDIQLSDGLSFDILNHINIECPIIFITAYDQYAIRAFKTTGIEYLLKPITQEDITVALEKYRRMKLNSHTDWMLKNLDTLVHYQKKERDDYKKRFLLKSGNSLVPVTTDQIAYFFREEIVFIKTFDHMVYPIDGSLNQLHSQLNPTQFVRLNRRILVQVDAIIQLKNFKPGQYKVELKPSYHEEIQISQERSSWLKRFLDKDFK